ncbi:23S rRNA (uracil(1939)-C(5))-methyltransferase RlmD [Clostridium felsineum]|uniref:23S rRNA (Uracil-C(5))-methyltransferase RlmCD n=1 Tax=Clostridium felsineum TaxID=36839 RepID=A0A1S8LF90_9CLOT|nr:23S rRNA (uracil(1939)-C(5))-methyltransferase RlmD [Clostridium felsineum]URZ05140.1 23S rRNA (uracil-C(5))-methyltransferase RlmCD [Clostridium felsineum]URZ10181.1 23S rRNA (uracil-C(5))-methyltransferase RlmCD [Clostridium felsineum]
MDKVVPVKKNNDYEIYIDDFGNMGEGIGKVDNFTVFVKDAVKGEKVKAKIIKVNKNFAIGKLIDVIEKSEDRAEPVCSIYNKCGGCQLQHLKYEKQLEFKKNKVTECLRRIAKVDLSPVKINETIGMETPNYYRNKVQLPVGEVNGEVKIGFYRERSHDIIEVDKCFIQDDTANEIMLVVKKWIKDFNIEAYNEALGKGVLRHIMIRKAFKTGQIMLVLVTNTEKLPQKKELIHRITTEIKGIKGIIQNINNKKTNVVLGQREITLWGENIIEDYIGEFKFNVSSKSFFQVNPVQTEKLYETALRFAGLTGNEVVFDAYCGTGTISLFLSQKANKVYGVEMVPEAIENAKINAQQNGVDNAEFIVGKAEEEIPKLIEKGIKPEIVVVDPPRKGCEKALLESIASGEPRTIVYVSCDPATLSRDLGILNELGYEVKEVQPVDMFPETGHVETVVLLQRGIM